MIKNTFLNNFVVAARKTLTFDQSIFVTLKINYVKSLIFYYNVELLLIPPQFSKFICCSTFFKYWMLK